jgi:hypothetical protein
MMAAWSASVLTPIIAPLVAELAASRQTIERQGETICDQAEHPGTATERLSHPTAELDAMKASQAQQTSNLTAEIEDPTEDAPEPSPPTIPLPPEDEPAVRSAWWRRWLSAVYGW